MASFSKFLLCLFLDAIVFYLIFLILKKIVHSQMGEGWLTSKRHAMAMKTGFVAFVSAFMAFWGCALSFWLNQKWSGIIWVLIFMFSLCLGFFSALGGWFNILTGRTKKDIEVKSDWDFWKFLR